MKKEELLALIDANIYQNNNKEITGTKLNYVLKQMVDNICNFDPEGPDLTEPLTFEAIEDNTPIVAMFQDMEDESTTRTLLYSIDNGATWQSASVGAEPATITTLNAGQTVQLRGDSFCSGGMFMVADMLASEPLRSQITAGPTLKPFYAYGNIMSLLTTEGFDELTEVPQSAFAMLFAGQLIDIYPEHPLLLPATTLAQGCYLEMFSGCTALTTAPELPATTLAQQCYAGMFEGCTSLTAAPELPAKTLVASCYGTMRGGGMFLNCTNLSEVKCYAEDISAAFCTTGWLDGVAATGTFYRSANNSDWTIGADGIPQGWTVVEV